MSRSEGQFILIMTLINSFLILTSLGIDIARLNISMLFNKKVVAQIIDTFDKHFLKC